MQPVTLYQFALCPFSHKVKAALDVKGIPYTQVEVNPMTKKELPELPDDVRRKVPVIQVDGSTVIDSTSILGYLEQTYGDSLTPSDPEQRAKSDTIEQWVDDDLAYVLPTVIYGRWGDAVRAARVVAKTSNFGPVQNAIVRAGGSLIMHQVAKRIVKKRGGGSPQQMVDAEMDKFEEWLGDQPFLCGDEPSVADVAAQGCLTCVQEFPAFATIMARPRVASWYQRVQDLRDANRAQA
jgi:glutathione S-transferase